mmetsp:Transcript_6733/g.12031  ORF Transcript_6733/g.12031 Transcript_6733/m.12031 type:complete len:1058 (-) Transcript_6733:1445-4618(-)
MDDEGLYDDFGNYIGETTTGNENSNSVNLRHGPELNGNFDLKDKNERRNDNNDDFERDGIEDKSDDEDLNSIDDLDYVENAIVLPEDRELFPSADQVFGEDVETLVQEEDLQTISQPIVAPEAQSTLVIDSKLTGIHSPTPHFEHQYLSDLSRYTPSKVRNVALIGAHHHGKSTLVDLIMSQTHLMSEKDIEPQHRVPLRYSDTRTDEQTRGLSIQNTLISVLVSARSCSDIVPCEPTSYALNIIDTPGHSDFLCSTIAAMRMCDGVLLAVDVVEGVLMTTKTLLGEAILRQLPVVLVLTKMDRLALELRLPPADAYLKLLSIVNELNIIVRSIHNTKTQSYFDPRNGNVCFACSQQGYCFSLYEFAAMYARRQNLECSVTHLASRLWGDVYYSVERSEFVDSENPDTELSRSFVQFILDPIYKLIAACLGDEVDTLREKLNALGISSAKISQSDLRTDSRTLMRRILPAFLGQHARLSLPSMLINHLPSPVESSQRILNTLYTGPSTSRIAELLKKQLTESDATHSTESYALAGCVVYVKDKDGSLTLASIVRIFSGTLARSTEVRILGDQFDSQENPDDWNAITMNRIERSCGRYQIPLKSAQAGDMVLMYGMADMLNAGSGTLVWNLHEEIESIYPLLPLRRDLNSHMFLTAVVRVALEPLRPSELLRMVDGIRKCTVVYPGLTAIVEESGEHALVGPGELAMDCALHDIRNAFVPELEIKVSDPSVPFRESVGIRSSVSTSATTTNKKASLSMLAEPLDINLTLALERGDFAKLVEPETVRDTLGSGIDNQESNERKRLQNRLQKEYGWDILAARSVWAFGSESVTGSNCLLNDIVGGGDARLGADGARTSIVQGFQWAMREGPLCDEPVRGVCLRLINAVVGTSVNERSPAHIIPAARRASLCSMLTAQPKLLEPVYRIEILCSSVDFVRAISSLLNQRRGHIVEQHELRGTAFRRVYALLPVLDSFGFETDVRLITMGAASVVQQADHWAIVPGDPLDETVILRPLEPAQPDALSRECFLKTRRRKGLGDASAIRRLFDDPSLFDIARESY